MVQKYQCTVCRYIYNPVDGDPTQDISPGIAFEDLPEAWACPMCGAPKEAFEKVQ